MIVLLDGRDGAPLKEWLRSHDKVRLVARDRASAYASSISEMLPDCIQVADWFHLLQNLLGYMNDIFREDERIYDNKKHDLKSPQYQDGVRKNSN